MDENGNMDLRNWGFLDTPNSSLKNHLGLQLMPSISEKSLFATVAVGDSDPKPPAIASANFGPFHHHRVGSITESHAPVDYWMNQNRERYLNLISGHHHHHHYHGYYQHSYGFYPENSSTHSAQISLPIDMPQTGKIAAKTGSPCEEGEKSGGPAAKKSGGAGAPNPSQKAKKPRTKTPRPPPERTGPTSQAHHARPPKKRAEIEINGMHLDVSDIPIPMCSCTGTPRQCYRWGSGGWQSACCTTGLSVYPLPMNTKRRGARIAGRKMSIGAFKKVLEKLTGEGYNFSTPIDLKSHWAKHGTNKFVTIR